MKWFWKNSTTDPYKRFYIVKCCSSATNTIFLAETAIRALIDCMLYHEKNHRHFDYIDGKIYEVKVKTTCEICKIKYLQKEGVLIDIFP